MQEITVYTAEPSEVCARVKHLLEARGFAYHEIEVQTDEDRAAMVQKTGRMQCPLVYVGDELIGGFQATVDAERSGRLAELVAG